jgi:hypothetical protein
MREMRDLPGGGHAPADADRETMADLLDVLQDVLAWQLTPPAWEQVDHVIGSILAACADGDLDALRQAGIELEQLSPIRAIRVGTTPQDPAPRQIRDRVSHLIYSIGSAASPEHAKDAPQPSGRDRGSDDRG